MSQIIALGSGGFSDDRAPGLDEYILEQAPSRNPRILFIATASGDSDSYVAKFFRRFSALDCRPRHLSLFGKVTELERTIKEQDIIFVGGGNTKSMLAVWHAWGLPELLRAALDSGVLLAGISAGAMCWFEFGLSNTAALGPTPLGCLGFVRGSCSPHYCDDPERRPRFQELIGKGELPSGIGIDDDAALHIVDGTIARVIVGRQGRGAYRVEASSPGMVSEAPLAVEHLDVSSR